MPRADVFQVSNSPWLLSCVLHALHAAGCRKKDDVEETGERWSRAGKVSTEVSGCTGDPEAEVEASESRCVMDYILTLNNGFETVIDACDLECIHEVSFASGLSWMGTVASRHWRAVKKEHTNYAVCLISGSIELRLHRVLMDARPHQVVDHIDGNGLNNRRSNLRLTDAVGNSRNRHPNGGKTTKGVSFNRNSGKWSAQIRVNGKKIHLGLFVTPELAQAAYNEAAQRHFGEFAKLVQP